MDHGLIFTRRGLLLAGAGAAVWDRLYGASADFWNKKEPSEWTSEEIDRLTEKSPWAKGVSVQRAMEDGGQGGGQGGGQRGGGGGGGMGWPGGGGGGRGGMGIPGMGGGGRGRGGGQRTQTEKGTVRWESAKPILQALKTPLPASFANHYVISVNGFPLEAGRYRRSDEEGETGSSQSSTEDRLNRLKGVTYLSPKTRRDLQPGVVEQPPSAGSGTVFFGFSKEMLALKVADQEVTFTTRIGGLAIKAKFNLKEMLYRGELAV